VLFNEYWSLENMEISSISFKNILKNRLDGYSKENGVLVVVTLLSYLHHVFRLIF